MTTYMRRAALALASLFLMLSLGAAHAQTPPPPSAFLWEMRNVQISPDGNYLSMIQPYEGRSALVIYPIGGGGPHVVEPGRRASDENLEVTSHFWSGDRIVITVNWNDHYQSRRANFRLEQTRLISVNATGGDPQVLFESRQDSIDDISYESNIVDTLPDEPDYILVDLFEVISNVGVRTVNRVNVRTGRSVRVAQGTRDTAAWATDENGNVIARSDYDDETIRLFIREPGGVNWRQIFTDAWFDETGEGTLSPIQAIGDWLYIRSNHEGRIGIYRYNLRNGGGMERLFLHDVVDVGGMSVDEDTDELEYVSYTYHMPHRHYFSEEAQRDANRYARILLGRDWQAPADGEIGMFVGVNAESDDGNRRVLVAYGPGYPPVYYLMDDEARTVNEIGRTYPQLSPDNLGTTSVVTYEARDGLEISGYLTLPPGRTLNDGPMPYVLWPHGGPNARDDGMFDLIRQFLATRGYAVFAPQFRGSRGFGAEFLRLGFEEWGGDMQTDLEDATNFMVEQGIADPDHMCIVGWSYSAYAAAYAAVDTPDLYNCAIAVNGVYDLPDMMGDLRTSRAWRALDFWKGSMGDDWAGLGNVSPNRRVDEIQIPILLIASKEDATVPYEESTQFGGSLRRAHRDVETHIFDYGNHSMDYRPNMEENLRLWADFLQRHM